MNMPFKGNAAAIPRSY